MKISRSHHRLLKQGFENAVTSEQKWQVVLMLVVPFIIGCKLFQDMMSSRDGKLYNNEKTVFEVVLVKDGIVFVEEEFWNRYQYTNLSLCHLSKLHFCYHESTPILTEDKLIFGQVLGWGSGSWYLDLTG